MWVDVRGLCGKRSHEKLVPDWVYQWPREQVGLFLSHLWATDGSVRWDDKAGQGRIYYATSSRRLADDVMAVFIKLPAVEDLHYRAGQYIDFILSGGRRRSFSLASAPADGRMLEVHVRRASSSLSLIHISEPTRPY